MRSGFLVGLSEINSKNYDIILDKVKFTRFFLAICITSCAVLLFYTTQEVYTKLGILLIFMLFF